MKKIENYWWKIIATGVILILCYKIIDNFQNVKNGFFFILSLFKPFFIGSIIAFFTYAPSNRIELWCKKSKHKVISKSARTIGISAVYLGIIAVIAIGSRFFFPMLWDNLNELIRKIPDYYNQLLDIIKGYGLIDDIDFNNLKNNSFKSFFDTSSINTYADFIWSFANTIISTFTGIVISVYILTEREMLLKLIRTVAKKLVKSKHYSLAGRYVRRFTVLFYSYFTGLLLDSFIVGIITIPFFYMFKVQYPLAFSLIVMISNMIPFFGPIIATALIYLFSALTLGPVNALWIILFQIVLGQIDSNLIQPKILGNSVGISPFWVIFAVLVFGGIWKVMGMIIGVPIVAVIRMVCINYIDINQEDTA